MRLTLALPLAVAGLPLVAAGLPLAPAAAQETVGPRIHRAPTAEARAFAFSRDDEPRAVIGLSTSSSSSARDTLGVLVATVVPGSPAEKAGIEEGNRIASVNGVNLRLSPADVGDWDVASAMTRRLTRELAKLAPGGDAELRVYAGGQTRTMKVKTVDADSLYRRSRTARFGRDLDDRASLGFGIGSTGSMRDTLGVLVIFVNDSGPAAKAGVEEGNRIAAINGVDLRVGRQDAGDDILGGAKARRLSREIERIKPGDDVELRVYVGNGQFRTVKVKAARASDLRRRTRSTIITGDGGFDFPPMPMLPGLPSTPRFRAGPGRLMDIDGVEIGDQVRRAIEQAMETTGHSLEGVGRALDGVGRGLGRTRVDWNDDDDRAHAADDAASTAPAPARRPAAARARPLYHATSDAGHALVAMPALASTAVVDADVAGGAMSTASIDLAGLTLVPVSADLAHYLGRGSERGLLVTAVPSWATGLRAGDVLLRVDGADVRDGDDMQVALTAHRVSRVELLRAGAPRTILIPAR